MSVILDYFVNEQGLTMEQAKIALKEWEIRPLEYSGKKVGELMIKNNEVHFAMCKDARLVLGRGHLLKDTLNKLLEEKKFLVTRLFKHDKMKKAVLFMGFSKTHSDETYDYFWINAGDVFNPVKPKEAVYDCY